MRREREGTGGGRERGAEGNGGAGTDAGCQEGAWVGGEGVGEASGTGERAPRTGCIDVVLDILYLALTLALFALVSFAAKGVEKL